MFCKILLLTSIDTHVHNIFLTPMTPSKLIQKQTDTVLHSLEHIKFKGVVWIRLPTMPVQCRNLLQDYQEASVKLARNIRNPDLDLPDRILYRTPSTFTCFSITKHDFAFVAFLLTCLYAVTLNKSNDSSNCFS